MTEQQHLQVPCTLCGALTDLPAVWTCACGQWRVCGRSLCHLKIPDSHRDGRCVAPARQQDLFADRQDDGDYLGGN
jgi:hypothetical protein